MITTYSETDLDLKVNKIDRETFDTLSAQQISPKELWFITSADTVVVDCNPQTGGTSTTWRKWDAWHQKHPGLRFTAMQPNSTVYMTVSQTHPSVTLQYSTDDGITWETFTPGDTVVELENIGDSVLMRSGPNGNVRFTSENSTENHIQFAMTGEISASDSIMYLLDQDGSVSAEMGYNCFYGMFRDCSSLVYPPELPATELSADHCYAQMFSGCSSLVEAPELPAQLTGTSSYAYQRMFQNCTSLSAMPELPSSILTEGCYHNMFYGCTSLSETTELSAGQLAYGCYYGMLSGCTSLTDAPKMDFTSTQQNSLKYMFQDCSALSSIQLSRYEGDFETSAFTDWAKGVSPSGTLYYLGSDTNVGDSAIPTGWNVSSWETRPLEIRARNAGTVVSTTNYGSPTQKQVEYSTDGGQTWSDFIFGYTRILLNEAGDSVQFRAKTSNSNICDSWQNYWKFTTSDTVDVMGNLNSLLRRDPQTDSNTLDGSGGAVFYGLFRDTMVVDTSKLVLPWTELTGGNAQFEQMFLGCGYLTDAPRLPATSITSWCYKMMFYGCSSLATAPTLPATTVYDYSYEGMFGYCTNLNEIRINYTGDFSPNAFANWVEGVASSGTFYYNGSDTTTGNSAIPYNWSVQTFV